MRPKPLPIIFSILAFAAASWLAFGYFGVQALFSDNEVNESVPVAIDSSTTPAPPQDANTSTTVSDLPVTRLVATGGFAQGDNTYSIRGTASVVAQGNARTLTLTDFDVTNGPDLFIYLVAATSTENTDVKRQTQQGRFVQLAALKGNRGSQAYALPADLDLNAYPVASIWCKRFSRNFGSALLQPASE